jgi:hypothetical protein
MAQVSMTFRLINNGKILIYDICEGLFKIVRLLGTSLFALPLASSQRNWKLVTVKDMKQ